MQAARASASGAEQQIQRQQQQIERLNDKVKRLEADLSTNEQELASAASARQNLMSSLRDMQVQEWLEIDWDLGWLFHLSCFFFSFWHDVFALMRDVLSLSPYRRAHVLLLLRRRKRPSGSWL